MISLVICRRSQGVVSYLFVDAQENHGDDELLSTVVLGHQRQFKWTVQQFNSQQSTSTVQIKPPIFGL